MRAFALSLSAALLAGCAAYGWADRPDGTGEQIQRRVTVRTIDVDADAATDAAALTRDFVDELRASGVVDARWSSAPAQRDVVICDVALHESTSFGNHTEVSASARCAVDGATLPQRTALAQSALSEDDRTQDRRRVAELAARRALLAAAHDVADRLSDSP